MNPLRDRELGVGVVASARRLRVGVGGFEVFDEARAARRAGG